MKKIGILTFHNGINHGAYFQALATFRFLKDKGYDVKIINYINKKQLINELKIFLLKINLKIVLKNIKKILSFAKCHELFDLTNYTNDSSKLKNYEFDVIIVGSDIVWNYKNPLFGMDLTYFGNNLNCRKLISFSASFGKINKSENIPDEILKHLYNFKSISVRDENSKELLTNAGLNNHVLTADPTIIYDFIGMEVIPKENKYLLIYSFLKESKTMIKSIKEYASKNELQIISVGYYKNWTDIDKSQVGPFEWLGYFKNADCIITSTYHGTLFSIKYNKSFGVLMNDPIKNKVEYILNKTLIKNTILNENNINTIFGNKINYEKVNSIIDEYKDYSINYLLDNI